MTGNPARVDPHFDTASPADFVLDVTEQLVDFDERLKQVKALAVLVEQLETMTARLEVLEGDDPLSHVIARVDALSLRVDSLEKTRRTPLLVALHVNEVTVTKKTKTEVTPSHVVANMMNRMDELALRCFQLEHPSTPTQWARLADLSAKLSDEREIRKQDDDRLRDAIRAVDKRVGLGSKLFARFNRRLVALTGAGVIETKGG
jgi:hypothetical protein